MTWGAWEWGGFCIILSGVTFTVGYMLGSREMYNRWSGLTIDEAYEQLAKYPCCPHCFTDETKRNLVAGHGVMVNEHTIPCDRITANGGRCQPWNKPPNRPA